MLKSKHILFALLALPLFCACSSEDTPEPLFHSPVPFFRPADNDSSETAQLRREFYEKHGSYLLFNDTLKNVAVGTNALGEPYYDCELLDVNYSVGMSLTTDQYNYTYVTSIENQRKCIDFMENFILYHFQGDVKPFSWFIADVISGKTVSGHSVKPYAVSGERAIAVSLNYILLRDRTEAQQMQLAERIMEVAMTKIATDYTAQLAEFTAVSGSNYNKSLESSDAAAKKDEAAKLGFIGYSSTGFDTPSSSLDITQFAAATYKNTEEQMEALWGAYPLVMKKYRILRKVFTDHGFVY